MGVFKFHQNCEDALQDKGWGDRDGYKDCPYCGSMEPVELADLIVQGKAIMSGSDWKYGWPHKFYVSLPNPDAGKIVQIGSSSDYNAETGERITTPIMGKAGKYKTRKFYSKHLQLIDDETFNKVAPIISEACGILWEKDEKGMKYSAPYKGFQKGGLR